eukprot:m51a1_g2059 hypothetical protein (123) ;mRNA; f:1417435-1417982
MLFETPLVAPKPVRYGRRAHIPPCCRDVQRSTVCGAQDSELREILRSCSRSEAEENVVLMPLVGASPDIERPGNPMAEHIAERSRRCSNAPRVKECFSVPQEGPEAGAHLGLLCLSPVSHCM